MSYNLWKEHHEGEPDITTYEDCLEELSTAHNEGEGEPDIPVCKNCLEELSSTHKYIGDAEDGFRIICPNPKRVECDSCEEIIDKTIAFEIAVEGLYGTIRKAYLCESCHSANT